MKFGVLYDLRNPSREDWFEPWPEFYANALDQIVELEKMGYDTVAFAEHHGDPDGYNPAIIGMMSAAAQRTSRIRIGSNIIQVPYHHPVMLAEQLAFVDIISGGRLDVGLGMGGPQFNMELEMLGLNIKQRPSRLEEGIEVILRAWTEDEPFTYEGKRWQLKDVWINPKPVQAPPPVFVTAPFAQAAIDRVARLGLGVGGSGLCFVGLVDKGQWEDWLERWRDGCIRHGRDPEQSVINVFATCFVADDPDQAWAKYRDGHLHTINYERQGVRPYAQMAGDIPPDATPDDLPHELAFMTAETAIASLREAYATKAPTEMQLMARRPGMSWEQSTEYLRNFAEQVMPHVRDL